MKEPGFLGLLLALFTGGFPEVNSKEMVARGLYLPETVARANEE